MKHRFFLIALLFCFGAVPCRSAADHDAVAVPDAAAVPAADSAAAVPAATEESCEVLPRTPEEAAMMEKMIMNAQYNELVQLCAGKKVDFGAKARYPLLFSAVERYPRDRDQYFLERKVQIMKFMLENGGADPADLFD